jgi:hypothetical protein
MSGSEQPAIIRKRRRRRRRRRLPLFPFVLLALLFFGLLWGGRWLVRRRPVAALDDRPAGYVTDVSALRSEYSHYYGKPIGEPAIESHFREAADLLSNRDYPGAAAALETLSRNAAVPAVFSDLGMTYSLLGDYGRSADSFREVFARDAQYGPARKFLDVSKALPPNTADPYTREVEPNNDSRTANLIAMGVPVSGEVTASADDIDYFRVVTPAAPRDLIALQLDNHSINFAPNIHIYDGDLRLLDWGDKAAAPGESLRATGGPPPNSSIYISVTGADSNGGLYVLSVQPLKAFDAWEPNDDIMSARRIAPGEPVQANIMDADDTDFYSFQSPRRGTITIDIRSGSQTLIPAVTIYNADRRNMGFGPELRSPGLNLEHTIAVEKGRTYYIQVWSQASSTGAYTLRID